jgi:hypothetical protein
MSVNVCCLAGYETPQGVSPTEALDGGAMIETPDTGGATSLEHKAEAGPPAPAAAPVSQGPAGGPAGLSPGGPRPRGQHLLIVLLAVSCVVAVAAAAVTAVLLTHRPGTAAHALRATVFRLRPGQCFVSMPNGIAGAHVVPCAQRHDAEIYGAFRAAGQRWPGTAALAAQARQGCQARLSGYLNPQLATGGLAETYAYPNQGAWAAGVHKVICEIRGTRGRLTGSVRAFNG